MIHDKALIRREFLHLKFQIQRRNMSLNKILNNKTFKYIQDTNLILQ